ncbi:Uncharacterised protein [Bordetella pertussis]|nr:Uncharacterised protein [Bordetella pertussis]
MTLRQKIASNFSLIGQCGASRFKVSKRTMSASSARTLTCPSLAPRPRMKNRFRRAGSSLATRSYG